jgi:hypothetical protein
MKVTLHLGAHKTGTTLLQRYLKINRETLAAKRIGVMLLREVTSHLGSWTRELTGDTSRFAAALKEHEDKGHKHLVISCEDLLGPAFVRRLPGIYPQSAPRLESLARLLQGRDTHAVLYLRPQSEFLASWYLQTVNMGNSTPFPEWYAGLKIQTLSWQPLVERVQTLFGAEKSRIADFRDIRRGAEAYIESFARHSGLPFPLKLPREDLQNVSFGDKGLEIAMLVFPRLNGEERNKMRRFLQKNFSNANYPRPVLLSAEETAEMNHKWMPEYERLVAARP